MFVIGGLISWEGFSQCIGNVFYICDFWFIFNKVFQRCSLYFPRNLSYHLPDCVSFGCGIEFVDIILTTDFFFVCLIIFCAFARSSLKMFNLLVEGSLLNLRIAAFRCWITTLHSSLNQGVLRLFMGEVFGMVLLAISINVSVKWSIMHVLFGFWTSSPSHKVLKSIQLALLVFQREGLLLLWLGWGISIMIGNWSLPQRSLWTFYV